MMSIENNQEDQVERDFPENEDYVEVEVEGDSYVEQLLKAAIRAYEDGYNRHSKLDVKFILTITNHKVSTADGNKDVAYLRLDKHTRPKGSKEHYVPSLVHQEAYVFKDLKERLNPDSPWKERLFLSCLGRLIGAGLEYAEFLRKAKEIQPKTEEERLEKLGLVKAESMPAPLSEDDKKYVEWVKQEKEKEGL